MMYNYFIEPKDLEEMDFTPSDEQPPHSNYVIYTPRDVADQYCKFYIFLFPDGKVFIGHDLLDAKADDIYTAKPSYEQEGIWRKPL